LIRAGRRNCAGLGRGGWQRLEPEWLEPPRRTPNRQIGAVIFTEGAWRGVDLKQTRKVAAVQGRA
jgi:hypothetical protein